MYPLHVAALPDDRTSEIRLRSDAAERPPEERATLPPPGHAPRPGPADSISEVLFRLACGDFAGAMCAAEQLMLQIPVVIVTKEELRCEPLTYWQVQLLAHVDGDAMLCELLERADVPSAEAVRVVCELTERRIIALR
jgi:hypothetical protein